MPVSALEENVKKQLEAVKSLADLDLDSNAAAIQILLQQCMDLLPDGDPVKATLQSIQVLTDGGARIRQLWISCLTGSFRKAWRVRQRRLRQPSWQQKGPKGPLRAWYFRISLPFRGLPEQPLTRISRPLRCRNSPDPDPGQRLRGCTRGLGNNAASGRSLISYSPVNGSGAISPRAGTLTISYFDMGADEPDSAFSNYEKSISDMSVTSDMQSEDISSANLPARKLNFQMNVGANQFACETVCFIYEDTVYAFELMQGQLSAYNYFPVFNQVVQSAEIAGGEAVIETEAPMVEPEVPVETEAPGE